jgi:hypothetical protein
MAPREGLPVGREHGLCARRPGGQVMCRVVYIALPIFWYCKPPPERPAGQFRTDATQVAAYGHRNVEATAPSQTVDISVTCVAY